MDAGLISKWDILEFSISLSASKTRPSTAPGNAASGALTTQYSPSYLFLSDGIILSAFTMVDAGAADAAGTSEVRLQIPDLLVNQVLTIAGWTASLTGRLEIDSATLYVTKVAGAIVWAFAWTAMRFYANGALHWTGAGGFIYGGDNAPSGVPLIGVAPELAASAGVNPVPTVGVPTQSCAVSAMATYSSTCTMTGGWRFKEAGSGTWTSLPVNLNPGSIPSVACGPQATTVAPTATNTGDAVCTGFAEVTDETVAGTAVTDCNACSNGLGSGWVYTPYHRTVTYEIRGAAVLLIPNLAKSVKRWGDGADYFATILRYGLPWTKEATYSRCHDQVLDIDTASSDISTEIHPEYTSFLSGVGNSVHIIEDPLVETTFAPYTISGFKFRGRSTCASITTTGVCPAVAPEDPPADPPVYCGPSYSEAFTHTAGAVFPSLVQEISGAGANTALQPSLYNYDAMGRYVNYVANPHWSFSYYAPINDEDTDGDGINDAQDTWELEGDKVANEYWLDTRTQWNSHPSLPAGENHRTRNSLVSAPLRDGALSLLLKNYWFGCESSWWGITRFKARDWTPLATKGADIDSQSLWSALDATLSFGAVYVTVNPSATPCAVYMDLGSMTVEPYLYPHLAKKIILDWVGTNVTSLSCYLDSADGSESVLIATSAGTWDIPITGKDAKYAGSWKQDFGVGYIIDEGVDSLASGISSSAMGDSERVVAFSMIGGQQGSRLRFVIVPTDINIDVRLKYPEWITPTAAPFVYQETGHQGVTVWADGPGVRFGSWRWFDYTAVAVLTSPVVCEPGTRFAIQGHKSSVLDALRWENLVLNAKSYDDGVTAAISGLWDSVEGQTQSKAAYDTLAFIVKGT